MPSRRDDIVGFTLAVLIALGTVATTMYQPMRTSGSVRSARSRSARSHFVAIRHRSWRK